MKIILLRLLLIFSGSVLIAAQNQSDTIYEWKSKFVSLAKPHISANGNWVAIKKLYRQKSDTMFIINIKNQALQPKKILCSAIPIFIEDQAVLGLSNNKAEFLNLLSNNRYVYDNVLSAYKLDRINRFALLTKDKKLKFYNLLGQSILDVQTDDGQVISDSKNMVYYLQKNLTEWRVMQTDGSHTKKIYSTTNKISKIDLTSSAKELIIVESGKNREDNLTVINVGESNKQLLKMAVAEKSEVKFDEIQGGKTYLIKATAKPTEKEDPILDIWYGNDPFVNENMLRFKKKNFWIWNNRDKPKEIIVPEHNAEIQNINSERYFLWYIPRKRHNFITSAPELNDAYIYDINTGISRSLGDLKLMKQTKKTGRMRKLGEEIFCSPNGKRFLASNDGLRWTVFLMNGDKEKVIDSYGLEYPVFSKNGKKIYFESSTGIWTYDIEMRTIVALPTGNPNVQKIENLSTIRNGSVAISQMQTNDILVENYDKESNQSSYKILQNGKWRTYIKTTTNYIKNIVFTPSLAHLITVEENFNQPPALYKYTYDGKRTLLFDGNIRDKSAKAIRQQILSYSAVGKDLHGTLYYPQNYSSTKKYPMVVHIYEMQRNFSNEYLSPNNDFPVGFQIRTLIERGYFVYLPDITYGKDGPGISSLECVNKALDAALKIPTIDSTKIGLGGHSHGGYETNFIATRSNRFAAYISGAGNSDIIRSYYSYNYNFGKPFYFQFESEQYQMGTSVAADKELYFNNSPILNVQNISAPILLWAGKKDKNIAWDQVMEFYIGLRRYQKDVIALFYQNQGHAFLNETPEEKDLSIKLLQWWDYFLKVNNDIPWINKQMKKDAGALPPTIML